MKENISLDTTNIINIKGVTDHRIASKGTVTLKIVLDRLEIKHEFHIVPDSFDIPTEGIIGRDFCKLYKCNIDYDLSIFTIRTYLGIVELNLRTGFGDDEIILPPRAEAFRTFRVKAKSFPAFIQSREIDD